MKARATRGAFESYVVERGDTLASVAVRCVEDGRSTGALDYREMERLAREL